MPDSNVTLYELGKKIDEFRSIRGWKKYHSPLFLATQITLEASELLRLFQWKEEIDATSIRKNKRLYSRIQDELADIIITTMNFSSTLEVDLVSAINGKLKKIDSKYPAPRSARKLVFIAAPFTDLIDEKGFLDSTYIDFLRMIESFFNKRGYKTYLAHRAEEWGKKFIPSREFTKVDWRKMREADLVVAFPGKRPSGGVHVELGWATSLKKPIIILFKNGSRITPLLRGLKYLSNVKTIRYKEEKEIITILENIKINL